MRSQRIEARIRKAGIPKRFQTADFDGFEAVEPAQVEVRDGLAEYVQEFRPNRDLGRCVVMVGPPGTGKTHLGAAMLSGVIERGFTALYTTVLDLTAHIRETYRSEVSEAAALRRYTAVDLLFLDELGVQSGTQHERLTLHSVLDTRYRECLPTILAGNVALDEISQHVGERAFSRLRENDPLVMVMVWDDHRVG